MLEGDKGVDQFLCMLSRALPGFSYDKKIKMFYMNNYDANLLF